MTLRPGATYPSLLCFQVSPCGSFSATERALKWYVSLLVPLALKYISIQLLAVSTCISFLKTLSSRACFAHSHKHTGSTWKLASLGNSYKQIPDKMGINLSSLFLKWDNSGSCDSHCVSGFLQEDQALVAHNGTLFDNMPHISCLFFPILLPSFP